MLVIPEDFVKDEHVLKPLIEAMMKALDRSRAKVRVCKDPRFHGTGECVKWGFIKEALDRHKGMVDLFLLCVDRDGNPSRRMGLDQLETRAKEVIEDSRAFFAENAWQEVEVWLLAGHDLPQDWTWQQIRAEVPPKERYYLPFAEQRGVIDMPGEGRGKLASEAASRYRRIRQKCREDVQNLESRLRSWLETSR